jgi:hypothetical protein
MLLFFSLMSSVMFFELTLQKYNVFCDLPNFLEFFSHSRCDTGAFSRQIPKISCVPVARPMVESD